MKPLTVKPPSVTTLPVLDATVNLSVVPDLTAKFASTSTVPLNSDVPVTVRLPPSVVAPLLTSVSYTHLTLPTILLV